ncbi:MAG: DnaJ domain-containing protein [Myxococcaceae bacterium]|nr:DnaJ domain-containing protein [Myxococcaceae bacterium]
MAPPILLVADDLSTIAAVKRALGREGYEVILATSAADAIIAWGHHLPGLVVLQPSVESDRGAVVLEELRHQPEAQLLRVVLLGEAVPGFGYHVEPLPLDAARFTRAVEENVRAAEVPQDWTVSEPASAAGAPPAPPRLDDAEPWRATSPSAVTRGGPAATSPAAPQERTSASPSVMVRLFGDLPSLEDAMHRDVEAQLRASLESTLPPFAASAAELEQVEAEARAEAARRQGQLEPLKPTITPPPIAPVSRQRDVTSFGGPGDDAAGPGRDERAAFAEAAGAAAFDETSFAGLEKTPPGGGRALPTDDGALPPPSPDATPPDARGGSAEGDAATASGEDTLPPLPPQRETKGDEAGPGEWPRAGLSRGTGDATQAVEVLARAEAIAHQGRSTALALREALDAEARALRREAEEARAEARREREARADAEARVAKSSADLDAAMALAAEVEAALTGARVELEATQTDLSDARRALGAQAQRGDAERVSSARLVELEATVKELEARREADAEALERLAGQRVVAERALADATRRENDATERLAEQRASAERALAEATRRLAEQRESTERALADAARHEAEREALLADLAAAEERARDASAQRDALEQARASLEAGLVELRERLSTSAEKERAQAAQLDDERLARLGVEEQRDELSEQVTAASTREQQARADVDAALKLAGELEVALAKARSELTATREALERADAAHARLEGTVEEERRRLDARLDSLEAERLATAEAHRAALEALQARLDATAARGRALDADLGAARDALEAQRARADEAEALAQLLGERLKALEHRQVMNLALPGRRALGVPRNGTVSLEQLAGLVATLVATEADVRLELGVRGGTRTLWFKRGALHGAESSFDHESLVDRARRDGLIDARQEADLRLLRTATTSEQLEAMKGRGFLREVETVPLLQRATEHIALEAFGEESTQYRLSDEPPSTSVLLVAVPRATLPLVAEALRRAVPADTLLERLGGAEAVCVPTDSALDLRALGFTDRERKMLSWADGEATVEDLALASGLKSEASFRALLVARLLGVIEVRPPAKPTPAPSGDLDVRRLEAKYDEVQDADYFTILGLTRGASGDEVERAYRRLSEEFDPLKYSGHPDASLQQRAQVVSSLLEEAARALEDERRRVEYARHLLD